MCPTLLGGSSTELLGGFSEACLPCPMAKGVNDPGKADRDGIAGGIRALNDLLRDMDIGVAHHQVEVFIFEPGTDRYLGRLCCFGQCPKGKPECEVPGCGATALLRQHRGFAFRPDALQPGRAVALYDRNELRRNGSEVEEIPF